MLKGYKTYVTGALAILGFGAAYLTGDMALQDAIAGGVNALMLMFVRNGMTSK